jgi:ferredoxin-NADP reductase/DMSO/TMAO reductase YedYZ heme-binding membrane subunit
VRTIDALPARAAAAVAVDAVAASSPSRRPGGRFVDARFLKLLVIVNGFVPLVLLLWDAYRHQLGVNEVNFAIRTTGLVGLVCLVLALAVSPLRKLTGWNLLVAVRRALGLFAFLYIAVHFAIFFAWDRAGSVSDTLNEIVTRVYLWFGTAALVLMIPLAITSTDAMVTRLGAKRWKLLHRLAYLAAIGGVVHYVLLVKADLRQPIVFAAVLGALLVFRAGAHYVDLRRAVVKATAKAAAAKTASAPATKRAFWSGELRLARIFAETSDVKTFRFVNPAGGRLPFAHVPGQYLNLALVIDGKRVNRSYTIASSPARADYCEITVRRVKDGYASAHLHDTWREGQLVKVGAPAGKFVFTGAEASRVVLIAGGVGVTPMMSIVRALTDRGWDGDIYLVFAVRTVEGIIFADELAYLQRRFPRLHVCVTVSDDADPTWTGKRGVVTAELLRDFVPAFTRGPVLLCGPDPMMVAMRKLLVGELGLPDADVAQEAFVSPPAGAPAATALGEEAVPSEGASVTFQRAGKTASLADLTVLEAAEECGVSIPYECRSGICGQCKTRLVAGKVAMDVQDALTPGDRAKGLILACQARPVRDVVVDA